MAGENNNDDIRPPVLDMEQMMQDDVGDFDCEGGASVGLTVSRDLFGGRAGPADVVSPGAKEPPSQRPPCNGTDTATHGDAALEARPSVVGPRVAGPRVEGPPVVGPHQGHVPTTGQSDQQPVQLPLQTPPVRLLENI